MPSVHHVPAGYHSVIPYLAFREAAQAIEFYKQVFGAEEIMRMAGAGGKIGHAEIKIGDSHIMLSDEAPEWGARSPQHYGGSPIRVLLYLENVDAVVERAVAAGAKLVRPLKDEFYGDRTATISDPFGYEWHVHTHVRDVPPEEMMKAAQQMAG